jgi:hypothetical protein
MMPYRFLVVFTGLIFSSVLLPAQPLTGIWKGYFITKDQSQYKIELQIQERNGQLTGVTYSYLDVQFYGKATITGSFDKKLGKLSIQEIKTVEVKTADSSETCIMNYQLDYSRSGNEEYLEGNYSSKYEFNGVDTKKGQDCGGGIVFLRRVSSSDFDTKPMASSNSPARKVFYNQAPPPKKTGTTTTPVAGTKNSSTAATTPSTKTIAVNKTAVVNKGAIPNRSTVTNKSGSTSKTVTNASAPQAVTKNTQNKGVANSTTSSTLRNSSTTPSVNKQSADKNEVASATSIENPTATTEKNTDNIISAVARPLPEPVENNRQNELVKEIVVSSKQLSITVYDNGEIDGDTVSVYLNGKVVLSKKRLSTVPLQLKLTLDEQQDLQDLTFVAENLGRIPPNTALMIVDTGAQQYRLQVLSTDKKNAVFRFRFQLAR